MVAKDVRHARTKVSRLRRTKSLLSFYPYTSSPVPPLGAIVIRHPNAIPLVKAAMTSPTTDSDEVYGDAQRGASSTELSSGQGYTPSTRQSGTPAGESGPPHVALASVSQIPRVHIAPVAAGTDVLEATASAVMMHRSGSRRSTRGSSLSAVDSPAAGASEDPTLSTDSDCFSTSSSESEGDNISQQHSKGGGNYGGHLGDDLSGVRQEKIEDSDSELIVSIFCATGEHTLPKANGARPGRRQYRMNC